MTLQLLAREGGVARSAMPRLQGRLGLRRIALQLPVSETRDQPPVDAGLRLFPRGCLPTAAPVAQIHVLAAWRA